jgi:3-oxoacyl-[acyl-carrier-protein] synthase-3
MIGIRQVTSFRPANFVNTFDVAETLSVSPDFIRDKIGMERLARKGIAEETSDLASAAARQLFDGHGLAPKDVDCLVLVTQNPDAAGLPHTSAVIHRKLGLRKSCAAFDISLGCSGYVQALAVIRSLMEAQGFRNGLLLTADPYSKVVDMFDRDTALIFGDGATATWMNGEATWRVGACDFGIDSAGCDALKVGDGGQLAMNGRAVFNFAATEVPNSIARVLERAQTPIDEIDLVLLHQGSRFIVETIATRIAAGQKTPFAATQYGNTISSSIPMILAEEVPDSARKLLLSGFGVGLAWATCILERL